MIIDHVFGIFLVLEPLTHGSFIPKMKIMNIVDTTIILNISMYLEDVCDTYDNHLTQKCVVVNLFPS